MREILFRGKSLDNRGAWVVGSLIHRTDFYGDPCDDYFILYGGEFDRDYYDADRVDPETVGQFTGLFDKNGKKIFEGDIISGLGNTYVCRWDEGNVEFTVFDGNESFGLAYAAYPCMEVVGNIHDNPELIKNEHSAIL